ncbi:polysaccharide pyruvyl transferase family protein [Roseicella frigidaeris]|uniref:Polysaccharide pyruvyl transferase family protein n=1 Tax=Roseicella frigidaeris TaxID=2230885 RepID=A0A327M575_9PROT|nr:polysaccharide pyruvyl transferase family protein [Roseicella frigidaeris]RAI58060.1 polysaccharide pyruvyl transferase family protein [Roseicella frigidaeris]
MSFSPHLDLDDAVRQQGGKVPLTWARVVSRGIANLGDVASPVVVGAISGCASIHTPHASHGTRLAAIGTIGQDAKWGTVHFWGTGVDAKIRSFGNRSAGFAAAPHTRYIVHATRGPNSRRTLLQAGIPAPPIYGDGAWFLPRIIARPSRPPTHELGVIVHISELDKIALDARTDHPRYRGGEADGVKIISTLHEASWAGFHGKLVEILSCRRIVSVSLHGLIIAETYGIPCLPFPFTGQGEIRSDLEAGEVDHRFADFYRGAGRSHLPGIAQQRHETTRWDQVIRSVNRLWSPLAPPRLDSFFEAFPLAQKVGFDQAQWPLPEALLTQLAWQ